MKHEILFLDTEFTALRQRSSLISLALVGTDRSFYAEFNDFPEIDLTDWHQEHVISNLLYNNLGTYKDTKGPHWRIKNDTVQVVAQLRIFLEQFRNIKIWADVLAYDWVFFCELFGGALSIPSTIFYIPGDMSTLIEISGHDPDSNRATLLSPEKVTQLQEQGLKKHNALYDAYLIQSIYHQLTKTVT